MNISKNGIDFIKAHEGLRLKAYQCQAGIWTIGYGHTLNVNKEDVITNEQAEEFLKHDLEEVVVAIQKIDNLNQNQFDAACSLVFNISVKAFNRSTVRRLMKANPNDINIQSEMLKWIYITKNGKKVLSHGLIRRRVDEATLYFTI